MARYVDFIDESGNNNLLTLKDIKRTQPYPRWMMINQTANIDLAGSDLTVSGFRLLHFYLGVADYEGIINMPPAEVRERLKEIGMDWQQSYFYRIQKQLAEKGLIVAFRKWGNTVVWRINPEIGWKGKVRNLQSYRRKGKPTA